VKADPESEVAAGAEAPANPEQEPRDGPPPGAEAAGEGAGGRAEVRELERQLEAARQQVREVEARAQENLDRWQRAQADLANFRRRTQFEREEQEKQATAGLVAALLPVLDSFDRAWSTLPGQFRRLTWLSGVAMIHSQLRGTLERIGLVEIESLGQPFDPTLHEAVDREEGEGPPHVVAILQAGYKLHERVLRPTLVKVGPKPAVRGPEQGPDEAPPAAEAPAPAQEAPASDG
jgi:molecular chaperone GrpE